MHKNRRPDSERISIAELRKRFKYHEGELRRVNKGRGFKKKTGGVQSLGYHRIKIDGKHYFTHHLVFAIHHGRWPIEIDHKDRNKLNNRIDNLIEVSHQKNMVAALARPIRRSDGMIYESLEQARRLNHLCPTEIRKVILGIKKEHGGYKWSYA